MYYYVLCIINPHIHAAKVMVYGLYVGVCLSVCGAEGYERGLRVIPMAFWELKNKDNLLLYIVYSGIKNMYTR